MRCLIVDDDLTCRKVLRLSLAPFYTIEEVANGMVALERVGQSIHDGKPYDLIILEIMMPIMDGQSALVAIRSTECQQGIHPGQGAKIIMSSALGDTQNIRTAFREQGDGYITKPVDIKKLYQLLRDFEQLPGSP